MPDVSFYEKDIQNLISKYKFDLGIVIEVVKENISKIEKKYKKVNYLETNDIVMDYYHIKLLKKSTILRYVPAAGKKVRKIYNVGDIVLVAYLQDNYEPIILTDIGSLHKEMIFQEELPPSFSEGDVYISTYKGSSIHLSDNKIIIKGSSNIDEQSPVIVSVGETEETSSKTNEPFIYVVFNTNGKIIAIDREGNIEISSPNFTNFTSILEEFITDSKEVVIGNETNDNNKRTGIEKQIIHKKKQVYVGEEYEIKVGDKDKSDNRNKAVFRLNSTYKIELVGDDGKAKGSIEIDNEKQKLVIEYKGKSIIIDGDTQMIKIGSETATEPLVLGHQLMSFLVPLYGWATAVGAILGLPPQNFGCNPPGTNLISTKQFTQQT